MRVALASPPVPKSIADGLFWLEKLTKEAAGKQAEIICFPESFLPGYPFEEFHVEQSTPGNMQQALDAACAIASANNIALILPMDWYTPDGAFNVAYVISAKGEILGCQTKNQLDPSEDETWMPGTERSIFEVNGVKFGIVICHEGFRYPELVRWAARQGAEIVFHPHCAGSNVSGYELVEWGEKNNPYYEKAMMMRALENTIYFASCNYTTLYPESATSLIDPAGNCIAWQPYREVGVLVAAIDMDQATGYLAKRLKPALLA